MLNSDMVHQGLLTLHFIGLAFGLGGAGVADYAFFQSIQKGDRITPQEVAWMRTFSKIVWFGLGLLALSGIGMFLMKPHFYLASPGFLAKMVMVSILVINGLFLNFYTTVRLTTFNFSEHYKIRDAAWKSRKLSFIFGAISTITWYTILVVAMFKQYVSLTFSDFLGIYFVILSIGIVGSLLLEFVLYNRLLRTINQPSVQISPAPSSPALATPTVAQSPAAAQPPE